MSDLLTYPDLREAAAAHLRLVTSLHRLSDAGVRDADRYPARQATRQPVHVGDVVVIRTNNRWRHGIATELGCSGQPAMLRVAYMTPTALDAAQRSWTATSIPILAESYPQRQAVAAGRHYGNDVTASPQAALLAYRKAVLAQKVARELQIRPWAAVVDIQYADKFTDGVYLATDQSHNCR